MDDNYTGGGGVGIYFWGGGDNLHCAVDTEEPVELEISFHIFVYQFRANNLFIFRRGIINHGNEGMFFFISCCFNNAHSSHKSPFHICIQI